MQAEALNADPSKSDPSSFGISPKSKGQNNPGEKDLRVKRESVVFNLHTSGSTKAKDHEKPSLKNITRGR